MKTTLLIQKLLETNSIRRSDVQTFIDSITDDVVHTKLTDNLNNYKLSPWNSKASQAKLAAFIKVQLIPALKAPQFKSLALASVEKLWNVLQPGFTKMVTFLFI